MNDNENNVPNGQEGEELDNIIVLNDENGDEIEFEFLDLIEYDGEEYVVLLPNDEDEDDAGEVVILKLEDTDNEEEESYVSVDDEEVLTVTPRGKESAELLETTLPKTVREKAVNSGIKLMTLAKNKRENKILTEKLENGGYNVTFILGDEGNELMRLTVFVADSMQLEAVKNNFLADPVKLYSSIITALTI